MLAMLCEKLMQANIELIDVNTDGIYLYLENTKRDVFDKIISEWQAITKMTLEETRFERMFFLTTADYFGEYYKKGELDVKTKGAFITKNRLGKGMEFPIIYKSVMDYILKDIPFEDTIRKCDNILEFCSFKKLNRDYTCFWKTEKQQRVNRFYASRSGAHLFRQRFDKKTNRLRTEHMLKDSPVILINKLDTSSITSRNVNYGYYISKAREIINTVEGKRDQLSLF